MNRKSITKTIIIAVLIFSSILQAVFSENESKAESVNISAALETLKKAANLYSEENWNDALFEAELGKVYDPKTADFLYLEALCKAKLGYANSDVLEKIEQACAPNMDWRLYDLNLGRILYAEINYKVRRYEDAIKLVDLLPFPTADSDYLKIASLYGLNQNEKARSLINKALTRWPEDSRFAKLFFLNEKGKKITKSAKILGNKILNKLYSWTEKDPTLLILASPFASKSEVNIYRLKLYRNSNLPSNKPYTSEELFYQSYAILLCLRYGIIDERTAVDEFFHLTSYYKNPILGEKNLIHTAYESHLVELLKLVASPRLRRKIKRRLSSYHGLIIKDINNDLIVNSKVYYRNGRPWCAEFDTMQDGYPEYIIKCNFGSPNKIYGKKNKYEILYNTYPYVKEVKMENKEYQLRFADFNYKPVILKKLNLKLFHQDSEDKAFFTLKLNSKVKKLNQKDILKYAIYSEEKDKSVEEGIKKVFYENGKAINDEIIINNEIYSKTNYKNGLPFISQTDKNGDGYFEMQTKYNNKGNIESISIDLNKNKFYEYKEKYIKNIAVVKTWDTDENGKIEIEHTQYENGDAKTEWKHPKEDKRISVFFANGEPKKLFDGTQNVKIIKMAKTPIYWLRRTPDLPEKANKKILNIFNQNELPVVSYIFNINDKEVYAIRSGGFIFAEIVKE